MNDTIDRKGAIAALDDEITITGMSNAIVVKDYINRVKRKIERLPSIYPEPNMGEMVCVDGKNYLFFECGECKKHIDPNSKYCQYCGTQFYTKRSERR